MAEKKRLRFSTHCLLLVLFFFFFEFSSPSSLDGDLTALLAFRATSDPAGALSTWNRTESDPASPCSSWHGVTCNGGRVTRLVLEGLALSGGLRFVTQLDQLRILSLKSNALSGPLPDLSPLPNLKLLFLSGNSFSGPIPPSLSSLSRLYRLDLSHNNLSGQIPTSLNRLSRLLTLRLNSNRLAGPISGLSLPHLQDLNLSANSLSGVIPPSFSSFPAADFAGNPGLCGGPLPSCRDVVSDPSRPVTPAAAVVASSPSSKPEVLPAGDGIRGPADRPTGRMSRAAVVGIVVGDLAALLAVSGALFCYFWRKSAGKHHTAGLHEGEKIVYSASPYPSTVSGAAESFERGKMVFFEGTKPFELEDLLRASAEMLGKGGFGTAYKAVLDDGCVVAVKRLREATATAGGIAGGRREFEQHMDLLGRLRHPNVVALKAYYYARDERLLVYDFMPTGSLYSLLHGNRGPGRTPLDWASRVRLALGAARGLAFVHGASRHPRLAHGSVKSTNVLVDRAGAARLADACLALLGLPPSPAASRAYCPPEAPPPAAEPRRPWATQKADVYAFGVVLLELLTGRPPAPASDPGGAPAVDLPRWVASVVREEWTAEVFDLELMRYKGIEEEMVGMLQIAMACTAAEPDRRPRIGHVVKMIEEIHGGGGGGGDTSPSHGSSFDSVSDSPSASDDTAAA